jgi:hypothetical protein
MKRSSELVSSGIDAYRSFAGSHPYVATVVETGALHGLRKVLEKVGATYSVDLGNALRESHIEAAVDHPLRAAIGATVVAPIKEEVAYRHIPSIAAEKLEERGYDKAALLIKAVAVLGFAAAHSGVMRPPQTGAVVPAVNSGWRDGSVPLSQLLGGANYQRLYNQPGRGPLHGLAAHVTNNILEVVGALPELSRRRRQVKEDGLSVRETDSGIGEITWSNCGESMDADALDARIAELRSTQLELYGGSDDDEFVNALTSLKERFGLDEEARVVYPGSSTHIGVAHVFGGQNVIH